jgi:endonuclease I
MGSEMECSCELMCDHKAFEELEKVGRKTVKNEQKAWDKKL